MGSGIFHKDASTCGPALTCQIILFPEPQPESISRLKAQFTTILEMFLGKKSDATIANLLFPQGFLYINGSNPTFQIERSLREFIRYLI